MSAMKVMLAKEYVKGMKGSKKDDRWVGDVRKSLTDTAQHSNTMTKVNQYFYPGPEKNFMHLNGF
jgi:hypothetical protein